jgi:hypothetical protein
VRPATLESQPDERGWEVKENFGGTGNPSGVSPKKDTTEDHKKRLGGVVGSSHPLAGSGVVTRHVFVAVMENALLTMSIRREDKKRQNVYDTISTVRLLRNDVVATGPSAQPDSFPDSCATW